MGLSYGLSYGLVPDVPDKLSIKISFPPANHQVPIGELPVFGSSSDNEAADCKVYLDWNNNKIFQEATSAGPGGYNDFSTWIFVYSGKNHFIVNGSNDSTAKMLCSLDNNLNLTSYNSIMVVGHDKSQQMPTILNSSVTDKLNH